MAGARESTALHGAMFSSLKVRNYRLFAISSFISNIATWISRIAQDWLILTLTGSSFAVGVTTALQFAPILLLGLYGGVIADRYSKRNVLLATQCAMALLAFALAALTLSGSVQVWHIYVIATLLGITTTVDNPSRQAFVTELVGRRDIHNAISLGAANFQSARLIGPAVAGIMITKVGSGWAFLLNGLAFLVMVGGMLLMRTADLHTTTIAIDEKPRLSDGLRYVASRPQLLWPIVLAGFVGTFGFSFQVWLSAYAKNVFHRGAGAYGFFNTLMAIGALAGALLAARRGRARLRLVIGAALAFALLEIVAALSTSYWVFAMLLVPLGLLGLTFNATANTSVQTSADPSMRGRVMSLYNIAFVGGNPVGGPAFGWITDTFGPRIGFLSGGIVSVVAAIGVGVISCRVGGVRLRLHLRGWRDRGLIVIVPRGARKSPQRHLT